MVPEVELMNTTGKTVLDDLILLAINGYAGHYSYLDGLMRLLAVLGVLPLAVAVILIACCSRDKWRRWGGWVTLISVVPAVLLIWQLEPYFGRARPFLNHPVRLLACCPDGVSFPSFEVAAAAALAFGVFAYGGKMRWLSLPYLVTIGVARVFCGIEYPLDQVWASIMGSMSALGMILILNPRHIFSKEEGWPVGAVGVLVVCVALIIGSRTPIVRKPLSQGAHEAMTPVVGIEEKSIIKGSSPRAERDIADALIKLKLPGRIRRVQVGDGEATSVAGIKFDAGPDTKPIARWILDKEALAIIRTTFAVNPKVSEVDVFGVTTWDREGRKALIVVYSVSAQRKDAAFLFTKPPTNLTPAQALAKFGLGFYRVDRGRE